ncbi:guanine nucleotide binding protein, alpha subunit, partial [Mycena pura]
LKVLLLGSRDSGKSTFLKQMRLNYNAPFSEEEIESAAVLIWEVMTQSLRLLVELVDSRVIAASYALRSVAPVVLEQRYPKLYPARLDAAKTLWNIAAIQEVFKRGHINVTENLPYYFQEVPRLFPGASYGVANVQDLLYLRIRSTGITKARLHSNGRNMEVVDVSSAESERHHWIHTFHDATSIIFLVSLTGYNKKLEEWGSRIQRLFGWNGNQMSNSMDLLEAICLNPNFAHTPIILCFNKNDVFERQILYSNISTFFPDFSGAQRNADAGRDYFHQKFRVIAESAGRTLNRDFFIRVTTATDAEAMREFLVVNSE